MGIPKIIHYCWFGKGEKSILIKKCMNSWKKYCPDWEIVEWNEDNFDVDFCAYSSNVFKKKKYAYCSDVSRLKIIYENGGIYLDTDVELLAPLDDLLENKAWFAYGTNTEINTGSGFGAEKNSEFVKKLLDNYIKFDEKENFHLCTEIDTNIFKNEFFNFAGDHDVQQKDRDVLIINNIWHYTCHHYSNSWVPMWKKYLLLAYNKIRAKYRFSAKNNSST